MHRSQAPAPQPGPGRRRPARVAAPRPAPRRPPVPALPTPALPRPALPRPALPGPALPSPVPAATRPGPAPVLSDDPVLHLLRRATFGATPELVAEVSRTGTAAWLAAQLDPAGIEDGACEAVVRRLPLLAASAAEVRGQLDNGDWDAMDSLVVAAVARACWSRRQLFEVMVDFWSNHLNVTCPSSDVWDTKAVEDRDVVRPHALGRFSDLLVASAASPAMLRYLDNASSRGRKPNENYGRELLELHTVGVGAGYTEADVKASTLALTGWTLDDQGLFTFRSSWHHVGPLQVLGWSAANTSAADGRAVGEDYLRYLAGHPATAARLARKLAVRFVSDDPPASLVDRLAATYLASGTAVVPVLRELFGSAEFAGSVGQKVRRPFEDLAATVRALGIGPDRAGVEGVRGLRWMSADLGNAPLGWHPPDGYPDVAPAWGSAGGTLGLWNSHLSLAAGWWPKALEHPGAASLLPRPPASCGELVDALATRLLGQVLDPVSRTSLLAFLGRPAAAAPSSEHLGWQLPYLVALVLDSPQWSLR